jgi:hypothetical protein
MSKVLIACEESQVVCKAFRDKGHEAYSCDILPTSGSMPEWHFQEDVVIAMTRDKWDMIIAFPPCTDLAVSGARWFPEKIADGRQQRAIQFFRLFTTLDCKKVAIENPIGIMSTLYRKPDQIIQPWQFGHKEIKATCLWLYGLPPLITTNIVGPPPKDRNKNEWDKVHRASPGPDRAKMRSKTYEGIATAMANTWG